MICGNAPREFEIAIVRVQTLHAAAKHQVGAALSVLRRDARKQLARAAGFHRDPDAGARLKLVDQRLIYVRLVRRVDVQPLFLRVRRAAQQTQREQQRQRPSKTLHAPTSPRFIVRRARRKVNRRGKKPRFPAKNLPEPV